MDKLFEISNLRCSYGNPYVEGVSRVVLEIKNLELPKDKKIFIVGESGIGKSTVLEVLGMMNNTIVPDPGAKFLFYDRNGMAIDLMSLWEADKDRKLSEFRLNNFSFIFQNTNLMSNFTAFENVALTRMLQGYSAEDAYKKAAGVLADLGLGHIGENCSVQELSGGQRQRLAFARAVLPDFMVLFGDEPTGNLDSDNAVRAMNLLSEELSRIEGASAVIVSHDMPLAVSFADIIIKISKKRRICHSDSTEDYSYGYIDSSCIYISSEDRRFWSNGTARFRTEEFEKFLKKIAYETE